MNDAKIFVGAKAVILRVRLGKGVSDAVYPRTTNHVMLGERVPRTNRGVGTVLRCLLSLIGVLSYPIAATQTLANRLHITRIPLLVLNAADGQFKTLREIWFSRVARSLLKVALHTPLFSSALGLVSDEISDRYEAASVIAIFHTPWDRLLATWCQKQGFALISVAPKWLERTNHSQLPNAFATLRRLVRHLRRGGRVVVVADVFPLTRGTAVRFQGEEQLVSRLPVSLAGLAGVPIVAVVPAFSDGRLHLSVGAVFPAARAHAAQHRATVELMDFFEREICNRPAVWSDALHVERDMKNRMRRRKPSASDRG